MHSLEDIAARRAANDADPTVINLPSWVDELCALLASTGTEHLQKLGFTGAVVVNIEWTEDPAHGYLCIGSKVPDGVTSLLASSLQHSATEVLDQINERMCETCVQEAEERRVVGLDHRNVIGGTECPNCGRSWDLLDMIEIRAEAGIA